MHQVEFAPRVPSRATRRPPRRAPLFAAFAAAALLAISSPGVVLGWTNASFSAADEAQMVTLINQARASAGLPALVVVSALTDVARWRSQDMWDRDYFSHTIPDPPGGNVFAELTRRGICFTTAGENIAINNYPDDQSTSVAFNGWMNSPGHKAIILGSGFNRIGIGAYKGTGSTYPNHLFTGVFIHTCSSSPTPTPPPTPTHTPSPTKTPSPTPTHTAAPTHTPAPTPHPTATPHATPKPTVGVTDAPTPEPTPEATPAVVPDETLGVTPEVSPGPGEVLVGGAVIGMWVDRATDAAFDGTGWPDWPIATATPPPPSPTGEPPAATDSGGSFRVIEPQASRGLLDAIVGDVMSSFLGR